MLLVSAKNKINTKDTTSFEVSVDGFPDHFSVHASNDHRLVTVRYKTALAFFSATASWVDTGDEEDRDSEGPLFHTLSELLAMVLSRNIGFSAREGKSNKCYLVVVTRSLTESVRMLIGANDEKEAAESAMYTASDNGIPENLWEADDLPSDPEYTVVEVTESK